MSTGRISKRTVDALQAHRRTEFLWDIDLHGFGVKFSANGRKVYIIQFRPEGRNWLRAPKRFTLGDHGTLTPDQARIAAGRLLAKIKLGSDPAMERAQKRREATIAQLSERYLAEHVALHNKPTTRKEVARIVEKRIRPGLGAIKISELSRARIKDWHYGMRETPYEANRALAYLSKMLSLAATEWELRPDNPCRGVKRFPEKKRERFFSDAELQRIGVALADAEKYQTEPQGSIAALRLLAVTGMRLGEVLGLRWQDVDVPAGCLRLPDAKAGARTVPLGAPALALLERLPKDGTCVIHGLDPNQPLSVNVLHKSWARLCDTAKVEDAHIHDLRHTIGTYAAQAGFNAFLIRDLLGHKTMAMTARYVERAPEPIRAAADAVAQRVAAALGN